MSTPGYERIPSADRAILAFETPRAPAQVISVLLLEGPQRRQTDGRLDLAEVRRRLGLAAARHAPLRRRLAWVPGGPSVWVDPGAIDPDDHLLHVALPRPGNLRALESEVAHAASRLLDRTRPLWSVGVVEGMADDRVALVVCRHLTLCDPTAHPGPSAPWRDGVDLAQALCDCDATLRLPPLPSLPPPSPVALLRREVERRAWLSVRAAIDPGPFLAEVRDLADETWIRGQVLASEWLGPDAADPSNAADEERDATGAGQLRAALIRVSLRDSEQAAETLGVSLGDLVVAAIGQALASAMPRRAGRPPLRALAVDTSDPDPITATRRLELRDDGSSPRRALERIARRTRWRTRPPSSAQSPTQGLARSPATSASRLDAATRIGAHARDHFGQTDADVAIFLAAAPEAPLELLGGRADEIAILPPLLGDTISVGVTTYAGHLGLGFLAGADGVRDLAALADEVAEAIRSFAKLAFLIASAEAFESRRPGHRRTG